MTERVLLIGQISARRFDSSTDALYVDVGIYDGTSRC